MKKETEPKLMNRKRDDATIDRMLAALKTLDRPELLERWRELYGTEPPNSSKNFLLHRLSYRTQELFYGGLDEKLKNAFRNEPAPDRRTRGILQDGTKLLRTWQGKDCQVTVRGNKYEYNNRLYRSLSGVARAITGHNWNGKEFFGIRRDVKWKR